MISGLDTSAYMHIPALRYDPAAYTQSKYYMNDAGESEGMDATGPFSWKFHRKLLYATPQEQAHLGAASMSEPRSLWTEPVMGWREEDIL